MALGRISHTNLTIPLGSSGTIVSDGNARTAVEVSTCGTVLNIDGTFIDVPEVTDGTGDGNAGVAVPVLVGWTFRSLLALSVY